MQPGSLKINSKMKREENSTNNSAAGGSQNSAEREQNGPSDSAFPAIVETASQNPPDASVEREEDHSRTESEDNQSSENANKQLVLYDPAAIVGHEIIPAPDPIRSKPLPSQRYSFLHHTSRVLPSVGAFTVQCANCFKWRLIPTKEKYEEIREHILEQPFVCETAREWRHNVSCKDEPDIVQDGSRLWAIDKPNIAQPPPGWQRLLRIRGEGSTKFADVYYQSPSGKRLRSMVEIQKYLQEHPEYIEAGVNMSQFSFQIPRPLQDNYVRKRPARSATLHEDTGVEMRRFDEPSEVSSIAWAGPDGDRGLQFGGQRLNLAYYQAPVPEPANRPVRKKRTPSKRRCNGELVASSSQVNVEETL